MKRNKLHSTFLVIQNETYSHIQTLRHLVIQKTCLGWVKNVLGSNDKEGKKKKKGKEE